MRVQSAEARAEAEKKLRELLVREAKSPEAKGPKAAAPAFEQIMAAVACYEEMRPPVRARRIADGVTLYETPSKANLRRDMAAVARALEAAEVVIHRLPRDSRRVFARASQFTFRELDTTITRLTRGAQRSLRKIDDMPDKPMNAARSLLAGDVAKVMCDTLGIEPKQTLDDPHVKRSRGGGAYARILCATFAVVGIKQASIGADMREGLRSWRESDEVRRSRVPKSQAPK